jgi:ferric-dicitrate binding protein FerR (iron transport regulator)
MSMKSPRAVAMACVVAMAIAIPLDIFGEPQTGAQRAGEVSRVIPAVSIARGSKALTASPKTVVDWQDVVNTQANARARVALDDGSVLNLGADSSVRIVQHDAGAQQTDLEISIGKMRSQAQKITQPNGKFEVHTPAGVAGVVGTDFYVGYENNVMNVIVFDGMVRVCNLAGVCVMVKAGQIATVRNGDSSSPVVNQASLQTITDAINSTLLDKPTGIQNVHHIGKATAITLGVLAVVPIIVVPVVGSHTGSPSNGAPPNPNRCPNPNNPACNAG